MDNEMIYKHIQDYINRYLENNKINYLSTTLFDEIYNYIYKNMDNYYMKRCYKSLPLFTFKINNINFKDLLKYTYEFNEKSYENVINNSIIQSENYTSFLSPPNKILSNFLFESKINLNASRIDELVSPVLVALFLTKIPILENLAIKNDSYLLSKAINEHNNRELLEKEYDLLLYRSADPNEFTVNVSSQQSELYRITLHMLLRFCIMKLRNGIFNDPIFSKFNHYITQIKYNYPGYTSTPKGILHTILKIFSFTPITGISKTLFKDSSIQSTYIYKYDTEIDNGFTIDQDYFNSVIKNKHQMEILRNKILEPILNTSLNTSSLDMSICKYLSSKENIFNILKVSGLLAIDIDRFYVNKYGFLNNVFDDKLLTFDFKLNIDLVPFVFRSAICIKPVYNPNSCDNVKYSSYNTFTIVKIDDKWFKYDPSLFINIKERETIINDSIKRFIQEVKHMTNDSSVETENDDRVLDNIEDTNNCMTISDFISNYKEFYPSFEKYISDVNNLIFSRSGFLINQSQAIDEISKYGILLLYVQDVNMEPVCFNKCADITDI